MTTNSVNQGIHVGLVRVAKLVADAMKGKLKSGYPQRNDDYGWIPIQDTIVIGQVQESANGVSIQITLGGDNAPYAAAFEWGSGTHATRGKVGTYPIKPRSGKSALAFLWPGHETGMKASNPVKKFIMYGRDGRLLFTYVDHPGIEAKPYIKPSIDSNIENMKKILAQEFKIAILAGTKEVEVINVGH